MILALLLLIGNDERPKVLFVTHSAGYRHSVVTRPGDGLSLAEEQLKAAARGFDVDVTQDGTLDHLSRYAAVVFYTTGELKNPQALLDFVKNGGGFVGIHCATDTFYKVPEYGEMIGGIFDGHPWHQNVRVRVEDRLHPATAHLGASFEITDEIYQFRDWDRKKVRVLLSIESGADLSKGKREDRDYALAWTKTHGRGRVFYTALGHREEVWKDARFLEHLVSGIEWSIGLRGEMDAEGFEKVPFGDGWKQAGPGRFRIDADVATAEEKMGLYYYERRRFRNFILKVRFRQEHVDANSGVFVRFPRVDGDPWIPVKEGYEIQIAGDKPAKSGTGAIYSFQAPDEVPLVADWNEFEITAIGQKYWVRLNDRLITTYTGDRSLEGMIGIQNNDTKYAVSFRDVRVKPLPDSAVSYHVLFDGREPKGWKMAGPGSFEFKDGALTARGGMGLYWHESEFADFTLLLDWRVARRQDNSGIFVRFPDPGNDPWVAVNKGYEIQICDAAGPKQRTGSVYSFQDSSHLPTRAAGDWNACEITAVGQRYSVRVNGELVATFTGDRSTKGLVGLQNHDDQSRVSYRNVRAVGLKRDY